MEAGKAADCYGIVAGHAIEQADAEQACIQADLKGNETWVHLPIDAWPDSWFGPGRKPKYERPVVLLKKALYGHPDSGTFWEKYCN